MSIYSMTIGGVALQHLPASEGVTGEGGGRAITERTTVEGRIIALRSPLPAARRIRVTAPQGYAISEADAQAIRALGDVPFTLSLTGYEPAGTFGGCVFEEPPRFPYLAPGLVGYDLSVYVPQGAA